MSKAYVPTLPTIKEETEFELVCEESIIESSVGSSFYDQPMRVDIDSTTVIFYYLKDEGHVNDTIVALKDFTEYQHLAKKTFYLPIVPFTEPNGERDPQWIHQNWKLILKRIVENSSNKIMKWMVDLMEDFTLDGRFLHDDTMSEDFVKFWYVVLEYSSEMASEVCIDGRVLVHDGTDIDEKKAEQHDMHILIRDRSIHGDITFIRDSLFELGHTVGADAYWDNAKLRAEKFYGQMVWYSKNVMKLN